MARAMVLAESCLADNEVPVGAVVVDRHGTIVGEGRNMQTSLRDAAQHAEMRALTDAVSQLGAARLDGYTLVVTLEPCVMCFGACLLHHLHSVVYAARSPKFGTQSLNQCAAAGNHRTMQLISDASDAWAEKSASLLRRYFRAKRQAQSRNRFEHCSNTTCGLIPCEEQRGPIHELETLK